MTAIAIHQPNYAPWLGYFYKMAQSDIFVFLDDVQFSKQSYINRVKIMGPQGARWLTLPITVSLGQAIDQVVPARDDWVRAHLDTLRGFYGKSAAFRGVWPDVEELYQGLPTGNIAAINRNLIEGVATKLGIEVDLRQSSALETGGASGVERLVTLVRQLAPSGVYISGSGGAKYQDAENFQAGGLTLSYLNFEHPHYDQGVGDFIPGLSIFDAVFRLGWSKTADLLRR